MDLHKALAGAIRQSAFDRLGPAHAAVAAVPAPPDEPQAPADPETIPPHPPHRRRLARRWRRFVRRFENSIKNSLQKRVTAGVDASRLAARQEELLARNEALLRSLAEAEARSGAAQDRIEARLQEISAAVARTDEAFVRLLAETVSLGVADGQIEGRLDRLAHDMGRAVAIGGRIEAVTAGTADLVGSIVRNRVMLLNGEALCRTSFGWAMVDGSDHRLLTAMAETGDALEPGTSKVIRQLLQLGDTALDLGAHVGLLTLVMASTVGRHGHVLAFEPTPRTAELLRGTVLLNGLEGIVSVVESAVGAGPGTASLHLGRTSGHNSLIALDFLTETVAVPVAALDSLVSPDVVPVLVKIDVEGVELDVLRGMEGILARAPDVALIVEFGPNHLRRAGIAAGDWLNAFSDHGFTPWAIDEAGGTVSRAELPAIEAMESVNLLMLRAAPERWPRLEVRP